MKTRMVGTFIRLVIFAPWVLILCTFLAPNEASAQLHGTDASGAKNVTGGGGAFGPEERQGFSASVIPLIAVRPEGIEPPLWPCNASIAQPEPLLTNPDGDGQRPIIAKDETWGDCLCSFFRDGEWYVTCGLNMESWAPNDIHISQPALGNNFTIRRVKSHDEPGWTNGSLFNDVLGPQNNLRIGRFIDEERTLAVEFNLDHTKYTSNVGQTARVTGTIAGKPTDAVVPLDWSFFSYKLHNGANHAMMNVVKRLPLIGETNESLSVAAIAKVGAGLMVPHAENTILGQNNDVGKKELANLIGLHRGWWQLNGWTTGVEAGFRVVLAKPLYFEITDKVAYSYLGDVPVYQGTARHNLWMNEVVFSLGITFGGRADD